MIKSNELNNDLLRDEDVFPDCTKKNLTTTRPKSRHELAAAARGLGALEQGMERFEKITGRGFNFQGVIDTSILTYTFNLQPYVTFNAHLIKEGADKLFL